MKIILIVGPAGGGKSTWAKKIAEDRGLPVIHTDDHVGAPWDRVPYLVGERLRTFPEDATVVLEGVRALSTVEKLGLAADVVELWLCDRYPQRPGTSGLWTRQEHLLQKLGRRLPRPQRPPR